MTINRDTYIHDMLAVSGGANVFRDEATRYPQITLEQVAATEAEVILLPDEPYRFRRVHEADFAPFPDLPAVRDGRIHLVDGKLLSWYGPRIAQALEMLLGDRGHQRDIRFGDVSQNRNFARQTRAKLDNRNLRLTGHREQ